MPVTSPCDDLVANPSLRAGIGAASTITDLSFRSTFLGAPQILKSQVAEGESEPPRADAFSSLRGQHNKEAAPEAYGEASACKASGESMGAFLPFIPLAARYAATKVPSYEVDDIVQDSLLRIMAAHKGTEIRNPKSYLMSVVRTVIVDHLRHNTSTCRKDYCELAERHHPVDTFNPCRVLIGRQELSRLTTKLSKLSPRTREILIAVRIEGLSLKEAAARFEVCPSAVEKQVSRAMTRLSTP